MKPLLLIGIPCLSIASYASSVHKSILPAASEIISEAPNAQQNKKILADIFNNKVSLDSFKQLIKQLKMDYWRYNKCGIIESIQWLDLNVVNIEIRGILNRICDKLARIKMDLLRSVNNPSIEIDKIIDNNIKEDWNIISKYSLVLHVFSLYDQFNSIKNKEEELIATFNSVINLTSFITQSRIVSLRNWFTKNDIHQFLQNISEFCNLRWKNNIEIKSLYSNEFGFDSLAMAIIWPHLTTHGLILPIREDIEPEILSEFVKGLIIYTTDIIKDPEIFKSYILKNMIQNLGSYYNLAKVSLYSYDGKESVIDMIDRKLQDSSLSIELIEGLKEIQQDIFKTIPNDSGLKEAIENYIIHKSSDKTLKDKVLEKFKKLLRNAKMDNVEMAIDSVLNWINRNRDLGNNCISNIQAYRDELSRQKKEKRKTSQEILKEKSSKKFYETEKEKWQRQVNQYTERKERLQNYKIERLIKLMDKMIKWGIKQERLPVNIKNLINRENLINNLTKIENLINIKRENLIEDIDKSTNTGSLSSNIENFIKRENLINNLIKPEIYINANTKDLFGDIYQFINAGKPSSDIENIIKRENLINNLINIENLLNNLINIKNLLEIIDQLRNIEISAFDEENLIKRIDQLIQIKRPAFDIENLLKKEKEKILSKMVIKNIAKKKALFESKSIKPIYAAEEIKFWNNEMKRLNNSISEYQKKVDFYNEKIDDVVLSISFHQAKKSSLNKSVIALKKSKILYDMFSAYKDEIKS